MGNNSFKIPFHYGTWAGLVAFGYFLIIWFTPYSPLGLVGNGSMWVPIVFIPLAIKRQRDALEKGEGYSFRNAFLTGMMTAIVLGFLKAVLVFMMLQYIDIGMVDAYFQEAIRQVEWMKVNMNFGRSPEFFDAQIAAIKNIDEYPENWRIAAKMVDINFFGGIPVSLLAALIYNRKPKHV